MKQQRSMQVLMSVAALLASGAALAQSRAVEQSNFALGAFASDDRTANSVSSGKIRLHAQGTLPLGDYFGASVAAGYSDANVKTRKMLDGGGANSSNRVSCSFDGTDANVSLFARRPSLGRIGVSYGMGRISSSCGPSSLFFPSGDDKLRTDNYRIDAEVYWRDFTFGAARTTTQLDDGPKLESTEFNVSWYPIDSLRVRVSGNDLYDKKTYGIQLEHQPEFLGDSFGVSLGYTATDASPRVRSIGIGFVYHFGTRVSLKVRDRQYR